MARSRIAGIGLAALLLVSASAEGQQTLSGIAGVVKDANGTPVTGVTVEASSPALIERVRSVVSDSQGEFKIIDLPPGTYTVTFRAAGFTTLRHEGIELPASFTATLNGALQAGSPEQTITVTATVALVDTKTSSQQAVVSAETTQQQASGLQGSQNLTTLAAGVSSTVADVGGTIGSYAAQGGVGGSITSHGKGSIKRLFDGLRIENVEGTGNASYMLNSAAIQQTVVETGGGNAESVAAGGMINNVPKAGSNTFRFGAAGLFTNGSLQNNNLDASLIARGLTSTNTVGTIWDYSATFGGPVVKDQLWFFAAPRAWGDRLYAAGVYWDLTQGGPLYTPDLSRPADQFEDQRSNPVRLTWQATPKQKWNFFIDFPERACTCRSTITTASPEATTGYIFYPEGLFQATWSSPRTSRLLFEGGWSYMLSSWPEVYQPGVSPTDISTHDNGTGFTYNDLAQHSGVNSNLTHRSDRMDERFAVAYVTGSHAIKVGVQLDSGWHSAYTYTNENLNYTFLNGVPNSITEYSTPYTNYSTMKADLGIYAQDSWTLKRLTATYGLRFSYFNAGVPAQATPPTEFVPFARNYSAVDCVPCWKDLDPRFGVAYDLFGNGKTAIKGTFGRFVGIQIVAIATANNPYNTSVASVTRTWNDANGNYVPDCVLTNPAANGECGPISNSLFGSPNPNAVKYNPDVINGWGNRDYIWDANVELQHQLTPRVSVTAGYYRNWGENFVQTDNTLVGPQDYSPYCVTTPVNQKLPGGGGQQLCGLYDIAPALFSSNVSEIDQASQFGKQSLINNFITLSANARLPGAIRVVTSLDMGKTAFNDCFIINSPQQLLINSTYSAPLVGTATATAPSYCNVSLPWLGQTLFKANGNVPLRYGFSVNATYQNTPGPEDLAIWNAPNSAIAPSLGRNLAACGTRAVCTATTPIPLLVPGAEYEARRQQLDLRFSKVFQLTARLRFQGNFDIYNVTNNSSILSVNTTYGSSWLRPTGVLAPRLFEVGGRLDY